MDGRFLIFPKQISRSNKMWPKLDLKRNGAVFCSVTGIPLDSAPSLQKASSSSIRLDSVTGA